MRRRDWLAVAFGGAAAATAVLAAGSAFRWVEALVASLIALAILMHVPSRRRWTRLSPLLVLPALAALLTAFSLIPLPESVRNLIDPVGESLRDDGSKLLDLAPWCALSRDAPGSLHALIFFVTLLGVGMISLRIAVSERGRYQLLAAVAALCGVAALVTVIHEIVGATRLYGIYEPHARPTILGPLLNENHLGTLMAIGTCLAIGLVMHRRQRATTRAAWMFLVLLCGAMTAASHSRGALLALLAGAVVTTGTYIGQRLAPYEHTRRRRSFAASSLPIGIVGVCIVVLVIYSSAGKVSAELGRTSLDEIRQPQSKFAAWRSAEVLISESPWVGVGRGGFEPSFTRVYPASGSVTFGYLENEYLQAIVDWGIPGGILLGLATLWFSITAIKRWRDGPLVAGALGALTAVAAQSNVDFGIELLGLAVPITIVAATVAWVPLKEESDVRALRRARAVMVAQCVILLGGAVLLLSAHTRSISDDHRAMVNQPSLEKTRAALQRHPLDYLGYALAAEESSGATSIGLLNHALRLHPSHPGLHRKAAQLLVRSGHRDQATIEYSLAMRNMEHPENLLPEIAATFTPELATSAIPLTLPNIDLVVRSLQQLHREDIATLWLGRVLTLHPKDVHVCNALYDLSLSKGDLGAAELAGRKCVELLPDHETRMSLANLLMQRQGFREVIKLLGDVETWRGLSTERASAWLLLCDARIALQQWDESRACLRHLDLAGDLPPESHDQITNRLEAIHNRDTNAGSGSSAER